MCDDIQIPIKEVKDMAISRQSDVYYLLGNEWSPLIAMDLNKPMLTKMKAWISIFRPDNFSLIAGSTPNWTSWIILQSFNRLLSHIHHRVQIWYLPTFIHLGQWDYVNNIFMIPLLSLLLSKSKPPPLVQSFKSLLIFTG